MVVVDGGARGLLLLQLTFMSHPHHQLTLPPTQTQLLPREARDWAYGLVSRYRHLFGEKDACRIPSEEEMDRFLDI